MRDPARIPVILERLRKVWEAHPDLRLGQLVVNGATVRPQLDPFYIEDEALIGRLEALAKPVRPVAVAAEGDETIPAGLIFKHEGKYFRTVGNGRVECLTYLGTTSRAEFEAVLAKIPDDEPDPGDEL